MPRLRTIEWLLACGAMLSLAVAAHAQLPSPAASTEDALRQMFDQAGVIFTGQVTAIRRIDSANDSTGIVEIDFAIEDAIRGASSSTYTLREWAGLASSSDSNFAIGHRYLMLLHAPGPSGLSSPIGGFDGAIPILGTNHAASSATPDTAGLAAQVALAQVAQSPAHRMMRMGVSSEPDAASQSSLSTTSVDLRWIATRVAAPVAYAADGPAVARPVTLQARLSRTVPVAQLLVPESGSTAQALAQPRPAGEPPSDPTDLVRPPAQSAKYADVLALLRAGQAQTRAAH